jgi:hypothetical protein
VLLRGASGGRLVEPLTSQLAALDVDVATAATDGARYLGLVFDATGITDVPGLTALQEFFTPVMRSLAANSRLVVLGTPPEATGSDSERIAQRALEGFTRSLGKEVGRGGTVQLVYVAEGAEQSLSSTLAFLLSPKSAYVSAQVIRVGTLASGMAAPLFDVERPLTGKVALVTGAARGIGASIAEVLHRDGATIVGVDVPPATNDLNQVMTRLGGTAVTPTSPPRTHRRASPTASRSCTTASTSSCTTPASPRQEAREHEQRPVQLHARGQPARAAAASPRSCSSASSSDRAGPSSASRRSPASPATSARPTTPRPRPASSASWTP